MFNKHCLYKLVRYVDNWRFRSSTVSSYLIRLTNFLNLISGLAPTTVNISIHLYTLAFLDDVTTVSLFFNFLLLFKPLLCEARNFARFCIHEICI